MADKHYIHLNKEDIEKAIGLVLFVREAASSKHSREQIREMALQLLKNTEAQGENPVPPCTHPS